MVPSTEHLEVPRTARIASCGERRAPRSLWICCHGYRQLAARFLRPFDAAGAEGVLFVAPEALNRFYVGDRDGVHGADARVGATWMTREDRDAEIADYVRYLDRVHQHITSGIESSPVVVALGFSQGTATASRWLAHGAARVDHLVLWAGAAAPELDVTSARFRALRSVTLVAGNTDPWATDERVEAERARFAQAGTHVRVVRFAGDHRVDAATIARLAEVLV